MKKTLTINLGSRPFVIDEDAYDALSTYLHQIKVRQDNPEATMPGIECELADMLADCGLQIIDIEAIRSAIKIYGDPQSRFGAPREIPAGASASERPPKKLYRSRKDRVIAGVCGGIADYFGIDPLAVRLISLILLFFGGGFLVYIILWIAIPEQPLAAPGQDTDPGQSKQ